MHFVNLINSPSLDLFYPYRTVSKPIIALPFYLPLQGRNLGIKINNSDVYRQLKKQQEEYDHRQQKIWRYNNNSLRRGNMRLSGLTTCNPKRSGEGNVNCLFTCL